MKAKDVGSAESTAWVGRSVQFPVANELACFSVEKQENATNAVTLTIASVAARDCVVENIGKTGADDLIVQVCLSCFYRLGLVQP